MYQFRLHLLADKLAIMVSYDSILCDLCGDGLQRVFSEPVNMNQIVVHMNRQVITSAWADKTCLHSVYTQAQPFIFGYTLGCMVARTTNASAAANGPPTVWETLAN